MLAGTLLDRELDKARRLGYPVGVLVIDVDEFKTVNDTLGHLQGDKALGAVGRTLHRTLRKIDALARFGGDESWRCCPVTRRRCAAWARSCARP